MKSVMCLVWLTIGSVWAQVGLQRRTADELLGRGDGYHAMTMYRSLLRTEPNNPELHYNLGNALYQMQLWDDAISSYKKALSLTQDERMKQFIQYNISNCLYKKQRLEESIEGYKQTLRKNPDDRDARINLELALRQKKEQEKSQSDSSGRQKENPKQDEQDDTSNDRSQQQKQPKDPAKENPQKPQDHKMTRQEAERLLDALKDKEKEIQRKRMLENLRSESGTAKDW